MLFAFFFFCLPPSFIGLFSALPFTGFFSAFLDFPAFCSASLRAMLTTKFFPEKLTRITQKTRLLQQNNNRDRRTPKLLNENGEFRQKSCCNFAEERARRMKWGECKLALLKRTSLERKTDGLKLKTEGNQIGWWTEKRTNGERVSPLTPIAI